MTTKTDHERYAPLINALADAIADLPNPEAWQVLRTVWDARQLLRDAQKARAGGVANG